MADGGSGFVSDRGDLIRAGSDSILRRRVSLWDAEPPKNETLMALYRYWESLRPEGLLPARAEFDLAKLKPVMGMASVVDVDVEDPLDYCIRLQGASIPHTDLSKQRIRDIPSAAYRDMLSKDYRAAKEIGTPAYYEVVARLDYLPHSYARLILPFAKDGRRVNQLLVCSVHVKFPDLLQALD